MECEVVLSLFESRLLLLGTCHRVQHLPTPSSHSSHRIPPSLQENIRCDPLPNRVPAPMTRPQGSLQRRPQLGAGPTPLRYALTGPHAVARPPLRHARHVHHHPLTNRQNQRQRRGRQPRYRTAAYGNGHATRSSTHRLRIGGSALALALVLALTVLVPASFLVADAADTAPKRYRRAAAANVHGHGDGHSNRTQLHRRRRLSDETDWYGKQRVPGWPPLPHL